MSRTRFVGLSASIGQRRSHRVCLLDAEGNARGRARRRRMAGAGLTELCDLAAGDDAEPRRRRSRWRSRRRAGRWSRCCWSAALRSLPSIPSSSTASAIASRSPAPRTTAATPMCSADSLRTDRQAFRRLAVDDPLVIELREWSRMHERAASRSARAWPTGCASSCGGTIRRPPSSTDDVAGRLVPRPVGAGADPGQGGAKRARRRSARILKSHRIRRLDAADGAADPAQAAAVRRARHDRGRQRPYPQPSRHACVWSISRSRRPTSRSGRALRQRSKRRRRPRRGRFASSATSTILRSCPGLGRINHRHAARRGLQSLCGDEITTCCALLCGRGSGDPPQRQELHRDAAPCLQQPAAERRLSLVARRHPARSDQHDNATTRLRRRGHSHASGAARRRRSACSMSCARCSNGRRSYDPDRTSRADRGRGMTSHPFVRPQRPSLRPDLPPGRAPRADAVQDAACGTGEAGAKRPGQRRARRYPGGRGTISSRGYRPASPPLTNGQGPTVPHSITSSARASSNGGMSRPSAFAA